MVTFYCEGCGETLKKNQLEKHSFGCRGPFTCIDCSTTFHGNDHKGHTSCMTEAEKYQGKLYKPTKKELKLQKKNNNSNSNSSDGKIISNNTTAKSETVKIDKVENVKAPEETTKTEEKKSKKRKLAETVIETKDKTTNGKDENHEDSKSSIKWKRSIRVVLKKTENGEMPLEELKEEVKKYMAEKYPNQLLIDNEFSDTFEQKVRDFDIIVRLNKKAKTE